MVAQKCKNIFLQAAVKDFWSSADPKLKKIQKWGFSRVTFVFKWFKILFHSESSEKKLNFAGFQNCEKQRSHLMMS